MRHPAALLLALAGFLALPLHSAPIAPELQKRLLAIYDAYNKAIQTGDLDGALALRPAEIVKQLREEMKTPADRQAFLQFSRETIPDKIEVLHAANLKSGAQAVVYTIASKNVGAIVRAELKLEFTTQDGAWKLAQPTFGPDPDKVPSCASESFDPIGAYEDASNASLGGLIMRVAFEPQYTLAIVRVVDENNCAYLPNREELPKLGVNP